MKQIKINWSYFPHKKRLGALLLAGLLVFGLGILPDAVATEQETPAASVLQARVTTSAIITDIHAGGALTQQAGQSIRLPQGVKLTAFLVENYASVKAGDALARIDPVTVMSAIRSVQDTMDALEKQIAEAQGDTTDTTLVTKTGGRVKEVYAKAGDDVARVMLEHGALAVLSLDGLMAVELDRDPGLALGDRATVTLENGTAVTGTVAEMLEDSVVVTIPDAGYDRGSEVTVTNDEGAVLGVGTLEIHRPWNATAVAGTVGAVYVKAGDTVSAGRTLLTLRDPADTAGDEVLRVKHQAYQQLMLELFVMYQTGVLSAPCDGVVSGVDKNSEHLLDGTLSLLANAPNGDNEIGYINYLGTVTLTGPEQWSVLMDPEPYEISNYADLSEVEWSSETMTQTAVIQPEGFVPVYERQAEVWQQLELTEIGPGDVLLFAGDEDGQLVWAIRVSRGQTETPAPAVSPEPSTSPQPSETPSVQRPSGGGMGAAVGGQAAVPVPETALFDLTGTSILTVTPQDTMTVTVTVDEQDIRLLTIGMEARVQVDVIKGETFTATVTDVGIIGANNGGSSKYQVQLELERTPGMLEGMYATVTFLGEETGTVLTLPVAALYEDGAGTVVYTDKGLTKSAAVTTGVSDGTLVEITGGLTEGQIVYYEYYEIPAPNQK